MQKTRKITLYENKTQLIISAIDKIVVEIFNKKENDKQAQSILLTGCSALTGTTSTCIGLAIAVANTQRKTLLIDCDMRKIVKYKKLNEQATTGLSDFLSQEHLQEIMKPEEVFYETNIENLTYIPCGAKTDNPTRLLCSTKMEELLKVANADAMVLHCLPAHKGEEITKDIFEKHANEIFEEAENRLHAQKAVLVKLMK